MRSHRQLLQACHMCCRWPVSALAKYWPCNASHTGSTSIACQLHGFPVGLQGHVYMGYVHIYIQAETSSNSPNHLQFTTTIEQRKHSPNTYSKQINGVSMLHASRIFSQAPVQNVLDLRHSYLLCADLRYRKLVGSIYTLTQYFAHSLARIAASLTTCQKIQIPSWVRHQISHAASLLSFASICRSRLTCPDTSHSYVNLCIGSQGNFQYSGAGL